MGDGTPTRRLSAPPCPFRPVQGEGMNYAAASAGVPRSTSTWPSFTCGLVGLEVDEAGRLHRLAARHVERAEVEAALDHVALERAVGQIGEPVGAAGLGGVEDAVDIVDRHQLVADLAADDAVDRDIRGGADGNWIFCHGWSTMQVLLIARESDGCALATCRKSARGPARSRSAAARRSGCPGDRKCPSAPTSSTIASERPSCWTARCWSRRTSCARRWRTSSAAAGSMWAMPPS